MPKLAESKAPVVYANAKPQAKEYTISDGQGLYMVVTPDARKRCPRILAFFVTVN